MAFPRTTAGAVPIVDRREVTITSSVTTSPTYGTISHRREGLIRRVRAEVSDGSGGLPFELSLYEKNPEGSDGLDGVHRIATYRVNESNVGVFPTSTDYILDSEEDLYYQLSTASKVDPLDTMYYSIKTLSGTSTSITIVIEVEAAGGVS